LCRNASLEKPKSSILKDGSTGASGASAANLGGYAVEHYSH